MRIQMRLFLTALLCAMASTAATAQQARPLRILVGFPPGSTIDVMARQLGEKLRDSLARSWWRTRSARLASWAPKH